MKVKSLLIAAFAALSMTASADKVVLVDKVLVKDLEAKVGETIDLPIIFETTTGFAAVQSDFTMPEGVTVLQDEDEEWFTMATNSRWKKHTLATSNPQPRLYRFVVYHGTNKTFAAGNDAMLTMKVRIDKEGKHKATITKVHWSTGIPGGVGDGDGSDTEFTITAVASGSGVNDITATGEVKARKVIENGQVYIIAGDKKYNVMGAEVK